MRSGDGLFNRARAYAAGKRRSGKAIWARRCISIGQCDGLRLARRDTRRRRTGRRHRRFRPRDRAESERHDALMNRAPTERNGEHLVPSRTTTGSLHRRRALRRLGGRPAGRAPVPGLQDRLLPIASGHRTRQGRPNIDSRGFVHFRLRQSTCHPRLRCRDRRRTEGRLVVPRARTGQGATGRPERRRCDLPPRWRGTVAGRYAAYGGILKCIPPAIAGTPVEGTCGTVAGRNRCSHA